MTSNLTSFSYHNPTAIEFGWGSLARLPELVNSVGGRRALVVGDPGVVKAGLVDRVLAALGGSVPVTTFTDVESDHVWDQEPPPLDHPLLSMDNVYATFHVAGVTHEARRNMGAISAQQIVDVLAGERPPRLINPEVWPAFEKRRARILS